MDVTHARTHASRPATAVVGAGALGTALALRLAACGFPVRAVVSRTEAPARRLAGRLGAAVASTSLDALPPEVRLVLLAVPDAAIPPVAGALAARAASWEDVLAAHTSGALTAAALAPLARRGADTLSFHPMQSFAAGAGAEAFDGICVAVEGSSPALERGVALAEALGLQPVVLAAGAKVRYHLAASMASNFLVTLLALAGEVLSSAGLSPGEAQALLGPLVQGTLRNVAGRPPEAALTGPIVRGDAGTVAAHAEALLLHLPHLVPVYTALATETVRLARTSGRLPEEQALHLLDLLHAALYPPSDGGPTPPEGPPPAP